MIEYLNQKILMTEEERKQREKGKAIAQAAMSGTFQKPDDKINKETSSSARNALNKPKSSSKKIVLRKKPVFSHGKHVDAGDKNTIDKKENVKQAVTPVLKNVKDKNINKDNNKSEKKHVEKKENKKEKKNEKNYSKSVIKKINVKHDEKNSKHPTKSIIQKVNAKNDNKDNNKFEKKHVEKKGMGENIKVENKSNKSLIKKVNVKHDEKNDKHFVKTVINKGGIGNGDKVNDKNEKKYSKPIIKPVIKKVNAKNDNKDNNKSEKKHVEKKDMGENIKVENKSNKPVIKKVDVKHGGKHDKHSSKSVSNEVSSDETSKKSKIKINDKKKFKHDCEKKSLNLKDDNKKFNNESENKVKHSTPSADRSNKKSNKKLNNDDIFTDDFTDDSLDGDIFSDIDDESLDSDSFMKDDGDFNLDSKIAIDGESELKTAKKEDNDTIVFDKDNEDEDDDEDDLDPLAEMRKRSRAKQNYKKNTSSKPISNVVKSSGGNLDSTNIDKNISKPATVTSNASDRLFDPDDDDMDDLKEVKVDYKSSFDRLAKNSIFDDDDLDMESSDEDDNYVENISDRNTSVEKSDSIDVVEKNEKKLVKSNVDSVEKIEKHSLDEKKSIDADLHDLENLTSDLDEIDDDETFWDILEQAGISIGMLKKFAIAVLLLIVVVVFFSFGGVSMFNFSGADTENKPIVIEPIEPVTRPKGNDVSVELLDSSLTTSFIIGTEVFDQVVPMGDFGNAFGVDGALTIGDSSNDFNENEYVKYVDTLRRIENLFYTNIYNMLDHSVDRVASLDNYITDVDEVISEAEMNLSLINARMDDYLSREQVENELVTSYENSYIEFVSALKGEAAYSAIDQFVLHEKNAVELRAKYKSYARLAEIYNDFLLGIKPRYTDMVLNRDALLKGVHVIDVENSDIDAILIR